MASNDSDLAWILERALEHTTLTSESDNMWLRKATRRAADLLRNTNLRKPRDFIVVGRRKILLFPDDICAVIPTHDDGAIVHLRSGESTKLSTVTAAEIETALRVYHGEFSE